MNKLVKNLTEIIELIKGIKESGGVKPQHNANTSPLAPPPTSPEIKAPTLPGIKSPSLPPMVPPKSSGTKIPRIAPASNKDPRKIAEQIKDGSMSTKTQKVMLKGETCTFAKNGQWQLNKSQYKPVNEKDPVLNDKNIKPKATSPEKLKMLQAKLESYLKNKQKTMKKDEVQPSDETTSEI